MTETVERRVALVTGSGRNIGRATALALAADGCDIVVNARSSRDEAEAVADEVRDAGARAVVCIADVRDPVAVDGMFATARSELGPVTVLVNNAAVRPEQPIAELEFEEWRRIVGIVLDGAFLCTKAAVAHMREVGWGRIINLAGLSGQAGAPDRAHVVAAKSGIIGLTKALAVELGPEGITCNAVSPGMIDTRRQTTSSPGEPKHHDRLRIPVGRRGTPEEVARVIGFLASRESGYINGHTLNVNGGAYIA
jgi:3-oxoacyl-[acyl-carrier protein] reductase